MTNWARVHRGLKPSPMPDHERNGVLLSGDGKAEPETDRIKIIARGAKYVPEFMAVMPKIMGRDVALVPFTKKQLAQKKDEALNAVSAEQRRRLGIDGGKFVSTDDVLTAHVWRSLCRMRCTVAIYCEL